MTQSDNDDSEQNHIKTEEYREYAAEVRDALADEQVARVERNIFQKVEEQLPGEYGGVDLEDMEFHTTVALDYLLRDELTEQEAVEYAVEWAVSTITHLEKQQEWYGAAFGDVEAKKETRLYTRPRGFLTTRDRHFLDGLVDDDELDKNAENHQRYRIRERAKNAVMDFQHLVHMRQDDLERVVSGLFRSSGPNIPPEDVALWDGTRAAFHFLFAALGREAFEDLATDAFEVGIERMYEQHYEEHVDVDVSFTSPEFSNREPLKDYQKRILSKMERGPRQMGARHSPSPDEYGKYGPAAATWEEMPLVAPVYWENDDKEPNAGGAALRWQRDVLRSRNNDE